MDVARLITVPGLAALKSSDGVALFPEGTVRRWMESDYRRFRSRCVVKIGGKTVIDLDELDVWLEDQRGGRIERARPDATTESSRRSQTSAAQEFDEVWKEAGLA